MRTIIIFLLCFIASLSTAQSVVLTPQQMKADLEYLNKYLKKWHPSYYDYTKKEEMNAFYSRLKDSCTTATSPSIFRTYSIDDKLSGKDLDINTIRNLIKK